MKKVLKTIAAIPVLAGLVAVPAIAADKLDLSGEMRTRAWFMSFDDDDIDNISFMDHRLRMYGKFMVNDQVQVHFRTDLSEGTWGSTDSTFGAARLPSNNSMQVDRAFLQLDNDSMRLRAGLQYYGYSPSGVINTQDEGLLLTIKNEVAPVSLFAIMDGSNEYQAEIFEEDSIYGFLATPTIGSANVQVFGAYWMADNEIVNEDVNIYMLGASVQTDLGMAALTAEIDFFGGEVSDTVDATGIQGWVAADFKIDDAFTVTPSFYYAQAADDDEVQIQVIGNDFGGWDPLFAIGVGLDNEKIGLGRPFDWTGAGAGAIGAALTTKYMVNDALTLAAGLNYITVEDDEIVDESLFGLAAGLNYKFMGNAEIRAQIEYHNFDEADDAFMGGLHLGVKF